MRPAFRYKRQQLFVAQNVGYARVDTPENVEISLDQFLAEGDELLAVDRRFLVGKNEEADLMVAYQRLDFVHDLLGSRIR